MILILLSSFPLGQILDTSEMKTISRVCDKFFSKTLAHTMYSHLVSVWLSTVLSAVASTLVTLMVSTWEYFGSLHASLASMVGVEGSQKFGDRRLRKLCRSSIRYRRERACNAPRSEARSIT